MGDVEANGVVVGVVVRVWVAEALEDTDSVEHALDEKVAGLEAVEQPVPVALLNTVDDADSVGDVRPDGLKYGEKVPVEEIEATLRVAEIDGVTEKEGEEDAVMVRDTVAVIVGLTVPDESPVEDWVAVTVDVSTALPVSVLLTDTEGKPVALDVPLLDGVAKRVGVPLGEVVLLWT